MVSLEPTRRGVLFDLFCGGGPLALGAEQAGFDVALGADLEPVHCAVHHHNFGYGRAVAADLSLAKGIDLRRAASHKDEIDLVTLGRSPDFLLGAPPCQGFSSAGRRDYNDPRNELVFHFHRLVQELEPRYALMENVAGMASGQFSGLLDELVEAYHQIGYGVVTPVRILNAAEFGVPQNRDRVMLLIYRYGEKAPVYPDATHSLMPDLLLKRTPTVAEALEGLPEADAFEELLHTDEVDATGHWGGANLYAQYMRGLANDPDDLSYRRIWNPAMLTCSKRTVHAPAVVERYAAVPPGGKCEGHNLVRLHLERQAPTLRAGSVARSYEGKRHSAQTAARPLHPVRPRVITVREGARLHSVPDWFRFHSTVMQGFRELGNSVPPLLARAVMHEIRNAAGLAPAQPSEEVPLGDPTLLAMTDRNAGEMFRAA
ncbi:MAG: DNA cytosine methyltransferase [Desulfovibrio sp.]|uniref:DNA cytosine methyltransferase n=1 Tax=Desulfovibrio sp. TaxID=885 RepID=UPI00135E34AF|nr:DNA cytosine methyltransferase [Desulfovibrio sp.]MTJ94034.1 DNA cytosine methyltransferase [Desulfovibrio sp.]